MKIELRQAKYEDYSYLYELKKRHSKNIFLTHGVGMKTGKKNTFLLISILIY